MRPVQYFSKEYLEQCRAMTPDQILQFLEDFRLLHQHSGCNKLENHLVPEAQLAAFKAMAEARLKKRPTRHRSSA